MKVLLPFPEALAISEKSLENLSVTLRAGSLTALQKPCHLQNSPGARDAFFSILAACEKKK